MALELRQSLTLAQQLVMTPQLQQAIKLLQLSRLELLETINSEIEQNPILEERVAGESDEDTREDVDRDKIELDLPGIQEVRVEDSAPADVDWESYLSEYNTEWSSAPYEEREIPAVDTVTPARTNLYSHLMWQLGMSDPDEETKTIGVHIIENLNEDGFLEISLEEISEITGFPIEEVERTLRLIQNFDPVGVAAKDTRESLLIQARFQGLARTLVENIIMDHLEDLEDKRYDQISKKLSVSIEDILGAVSIIQGLEPKPGRGYSDDRTIYVTPDIYIIKVGDDYEIVQNEDGLPKLRISSYYKDILRSGDHVSDSVKSYIQEKMRSAAWLIKSIHQRQRTIFRVTESIVRFQRDFLENGITTLKPLVLRDVAEDIGMHESTVSRVTTNKYVHTPQGLFELKFFFNSSISQVDGDSVASESVKERIRMIVKSENITKPFSDQEIVGILEKLNIKVARRTVAKYRESMGILPSRKRKHPY
ncbi:RNA polymerase sigma-54 factor [uncultured Desulfobacterium sp.]|uniref:RNA polymerase sigma-54 factor n=1 Tax=uncultured Desulfobacterium sp. TaxID=201089 RepID=A0A445MT68_9BACT|nr:RNA polymerase sigma-54 factor [uncultured Desulfobacterium sp.]